MSGKKYVYFDNLKIEPNRIFCIGRNYIEHIDELKNERPANPVIFMKPISSLVLPNEKIIFSSHGNDLQYECEIVVLLSADKKVKGISLGLDLTLRDLQNDLKSKGLPWEVAKAFDGSAPIGDFISVNEDVDLQNIEFKCFLNDELRQDGNTKDMIFDIETLINEIAKIWKTEKNDLIYTGTPKGVGSLKKGDKVRIEGDGIGRFEWEVL